MSAELLSKIKGYALSNDDINTILEPDTKIFVYPKFNEMESIDEAFDKLGRCVFLFLTESESVGHWLCMFKRPEGIEYFDSYGQKPDAQRNWLTEEQLISLDEAEPRLTQLLKASPYKVWYSTFPYQSERSEISTCGRWCVARLLCKDLSNLQFYNFVIDDMRENNITSRDDWVALFTYAALHK